MEKLEKDKIALKKSILLQNNSKPYKIHYENEKTIKIKINELCDKIKGTMLSSNFPLEISDFLPYFHYENEELVPYDNYKTYLEYKYTVPVAIATAIAFTDDV